MSEAVRRPSAEIGLDVGGSITPEQQDRLAVNSLTSSFVAYDEERKRLLRRRDYSATGYEEGYYHLYDRTKQIIMGPACDDIYDYLVADTWEYTEDSPLGDIEPREMITSTVMAVLPYFEDYTTIVGEDRAGRIPALIMAHAINTLRERNSLAKARTLFISGRIGTKESPNFRPQRQSENALVVTEFIHSGDSIKHVLSALGRAGFDHLSLAAVDRSQEFPSYNIYPERFFMGDRNSYTSRADNHLYNLPARYTGVEKKYGEAHARRASLTIHGREVLRSTRRDVRHFADEIVSIWDQRAKSPENLKSNIGTGRAIKFDSSTA